MDYLLASDEGVVPVEVKSGTTGRLRSLHLFLEQKRDCAPYGIRFSAQPESVHANVRSYPIYGVPRVLRQQIPGDWF